MSQQAKCIWSCWPVISANVISQWDSSCYWSYNTNFASCCELPSSFQIMKQSQTWCALPAPAASISRGQPAVLSIQTDVPPTTAAALPFPPLSPSAEPVTAVNRLSSHSLMGGGGVVEVEVEGRECVCWMWCVPHRHTVQVYHFPITYPQPTTTSNFSVALAGKTSCDNKIPEWSQTFRRPDMRNYIKPAPNSRFANSWWSLCPCLYTLSQWEDSALFQF